MATQDFVTTSAQELHDRIDLAYGRFAELVDGIPPELAVGTWNVRQVVAHVVNVINRYNDFSPDRLASVPREVDEINRRELAGFDHHLLRELLDCLDDEMVRFRSRWAPDRGIPLDMAVPFHGGSTIDVQSALTNMIGEFLVHGLDIARAAQRPWPIDDRDGELLCGFATQLLQYYVRPTHVDDLLIEFRISRLAPWALAVTGATAHSRRPDPDDSPDLTVEGPAVSAALLMYARADLDTARASGLQVSSARGVDPSVITELFEEP